MFGRRGMRGGRVSELLILDSPLWPQLVLVKDKRFLLLEEGFFLIVILIICAT